MQRCQAQTAKRKQCSRQATCGTRCTQHAPKEVVIVEPWTTLGLPSPHTDNRSSVLNKLRTKLRQPETKRSGGAGHLYIYYIAEEHEAGLMYWKIGMTERSVDVRLAEWAKAHKRGATVLLAKSYRLRRWHKWVERVVHLYFNYCRVYRYPLANNKAHFHSIWAATRKPCPDSADYKDTAPAMHKQVEWFHAKCLEDLDDIINKITALTL